MPFAYKRCRVAAEDDGSGSESRDLPAGHRLPSGVTSGVMESISSVMNELRPAEWSSLGVSCTLFSSIVYTVCLAWNFLHPVESYD